MPKLLYLMFVVTLSACASRSSGNKRSTGAVGLWEESNPMVHAIVLRKSDGTYRRKEIHLYPGPAQEYESAGRWSVAGGKYTFNLEDVSTPIWSRDIGKQWTVRIVDQTATAFSYISTDNAKIEERRIGEPTEVGFASTPLKKP